VFTRTTISGVQALLFVALESPDEPIAPARIAERLDLSASYLAKVARSLVRANILTARRGPKGGVALGRPAESITLLEIVEACQGQMSAPHGLDSATPHRLCAFHRAMWEVQRSVTSTLAKCTLADLVKKPCPTMTTGGTVRCRISE
jgi:Rrf2 family protein